jgi:hypothetical protein
MIMSTDCHGSSPDGVEDLLGLEWICVRMNAWGAVEEKFRDSEMAIGYLRGWRVGTRSRMILRGWRVGKTSRIWATIASFMHPPENLNRMIAIQ